MPAISKQRQPTRTLLSTAYHEAGHAVVLCYYRRRVKSVTIQPGEEFLGTCTVGSLPPWFVSGTEDSARGERLLGQFIEVLFAGGVSAAKFKGHNRNLGTSQDDETAFALASSHLGSLRQVVPYLAWKRATVQDLLDVPHVWEAVEKLAQALIAKTTLTGSEAKKIVGSL